MTDPPIRVLIAKPGLDGHDVGAKLVCRALMEAGMHVRYTGLRQSPEAIVQAAVAERADVVGLSVLSGAHIGLAKKVRARLAESDIDPLLIVGGNIPERDHEALKEIGVRGVFQTASRFDAIVRFVQEELKR